MRLFLLSAAVCSLISLNLSQSSFAQDAGDKDLDKIKGEWKIQSAKDRGDDVSPDLLNRLTFTITEKKQLIPSDNPKDFLTIKLDPAKTPAQIDLSEKDQKTYLGIYEIGPDTLKICFTEGGDRPKTFDSTKDNNAISLVLVRMKK